MGNHTSATPRRLTRDDVYLAFEMQLFSQIGIVSARFERQFPDSLPISFRTCVLCLSDSRSLKFPCSCDSQHPGQHHPLCVGYIGIRKLDPMNPTFETICQSILGPESRRPPVIDDLIIDEIPVYLEGTSTISDLESVPSAPHPGLRYAQVRDTAWVPHFQQCIGKGQFGSVFACRSRHDGENYATKVIELRSTPNHDKLRSEVDILLRVGNHSRIVRLHEAFYDDSHLYLVMDYCSGGDLLRRMRFVGHLSESNAGRVCYQLADAIRFMHARGVTHRDLKPENILMVSEDEKDLRIKVTDFGLSKLCPSGSYMSTVCGTVAYCAPEVIRGERYDNSVDVWSLGVLMFIMLVGFHPFDVSGRSEEHEIQANILSCNYNFQDPEWETVSQEARDIVTRLLVMEPERRMSLDEFLSSRWLRTALASQP